MSLARQSFLSSAARKYATFTLESGQTFCLQSLSELERAAFEASLFDEQGKISRPNMLTARSRMVCLTLVDDNHQPLFQPNEIELIRAADGAMDAGMRSVSASVGDVKSSIQQLRSGQAEDHDEGGRGLSAVPLGNE